MLRLYGQRKLNSIMKHYHELKLFKSELDKELSEQGIYPAIREISLELDEEKYKRLYDSIKREGLSGVSGLAELLNDVNNRLLQIRGSIEDDKFLVTANLKGD